MPNCPNCQKALEALNFYGKCPHCQFHIAGDYGAFRPDDWIEWETLDSNPQLYYDRGVTLIFSVDWNLDG